jgi:hypothetical protein
MAGSKERTPYERETLMFPSAEEAKTWTEQVEGHIENSRRPGVTREREVVGEAVAQEFEKHGEGVGSLTQPWEHSAAEHADVQRLVDTAFAKDLGVALRQAQGSTHYPRNIDLLHDVLTSEMYETMRSRRLNRQPVGVGLMVMGGILLLVGLVVIWLMVL